MSFEEVGCLSYHIVCYLNDVTEAFAAVVSGHLKNIDFQILPVLENQLISVPNSWHSDEMDEHRKT